MLIERRTDQEFAAPAYPRQRVRSLYSFNLLSPAADPATACRGSLQSTPFRLARPFIPIYVSALGQGQLWSPMSWVLLGTLLVATATLWVFVGHLAQRLLRRSPQDE